MSPICCRVCGDNAYELQLCATHFAEYHEWKRTEGDSTSTNRVNEYVDLCDETAAHNQHVAERLAPKEES